MREISVTFPAGPSGQLALVRSKEPGQKPEFRTVVLGRPAHARESAEEIEAFIIAHIESGPVQWRGWLWEA